MPSFNKVIVMGNLTRDPEVRQVGANAVKVCRFALALNERRRDRNGNMVDYKVPTFMDADVEMKITLVEQAHPEGPYGVKGIGEPGLAPTAAAMVNAVCNACEADFTSIPIKPEHILFRKEKGHASQV